MTKIRIVAAVVDTRQLTLYKEDGTTIHIPQGDGRIRQILDEVTPGLTNNSGCVIEIDLSTVNDYQAFEEKSNGFTRFFRVAKSAVASFFGASLHEDSSDTVAPVKLGMAIEDIMNNAEPVGSASFGEDLCNDETIVAVVGQGADARAIPGVESLKGQFAYASKLGSTQGVQNFLNRIAGVIDDRQHSVHDLLRFMEKGDLPIADDGSIVAYKRLYSEHGGRFTDPYTRKVSQTIGSYVCIDRNLVDLNRRNDCSAGLHIGRRGYMGSFNGDTIMICKIAPEDVMVVPHQDPNKVRVLGYHIVGQLNDAGFRLVTDNRPATSDAETAAQLSSIISGLHIPITERVQINGAKGSDIVVTKADGTRGAPLAEEAPPKKTMPLPVSKAPVTKHKALDDTVPAASVDPKAVAKEVTAARNAAPALGRKEQARALFNAGNFQELTAFKKKAKVHWAVLGLSLKEEQLVLANPTQVAHPTVSQTPVGSNRIAVARQLFQASNLAGLLEHKRKAKVGWSALGFSPEEIGLIQSGNLPHETQPKKKSAPKQVKAATPKAVSTKPAKVTATSEVAKPKKSAPAPLPYPTGNRKQIAMALRAQGRFQELEALRKKAKVSWSALGFDAQQTAFITDALKGS